MQAQVLSPGFVDSIALNIYHDGSEGIQVRLGRVWVCGVGADVGQQGLASCGRRACYASDGWPVLPMLRRCVAISRAIRTPCRATTTMPTASSSPSCRSACEHCTFCCAAAGHIS